MYDPKINSEHFTGGPYLRLKNVLMTLGALVITPQHPWNRGIIIICKGSSWSWLPWYTDIYTGRLCHNSPRNSTSRLLGDRAFPVTSLFRTVEHCPFKTSSPSLTVFRNCLKTELFNCSVSPRSDFVPSYAVIRSFFNYLLMIGVGCCPPGWAEARQQRETSASTERPSWQETPSRVCAGCYRRACISCHRCAIGSCRLCRRAFAEDRKLGERGSAEDRKMEQRDGDEYTDPISRCFRTTPA